MFWEPKSHLVIRDVNVTEYLLNYRARNVKLGTITNNLKQLSLSHIFPASKFDEEKCAFKHMEEGERQKVFSAVYSGVNIRKTTANTLVYCKDVADGEEDSASFEASNEMEALIKNCCNRFICSNFNIAINSEAAFIRKYLQPYIDVIFLENGVDNMVYACTDAPTDNGKKPDIAFGIRYKGKGRFFFFVEVKRPGQSGMYQGEDDSVKLLKQMKTSVDAQISLGIRNITSLGLLVEGFGCILYMMQIKNEGVYIPVQLKKFFLPEVRENLVNTPSVVEGLLFVKEKLFEFKEKLKEKKSKSLIGCCV